MLLPWGPVVFPRCLISVRWPPWITDVLLIQNFKNCLNFQNMMGSYVFPGLPPPPHLYPALLFPRPRTALTIQIMSLDIPVSMLLILHSFPSSIYSICFYKQMLLQRDKKVNSYTFLNSKSRIRMSM